MEEWDQLFLPEETIILRFEVKKWIAGFAVPEVGETSLDSQPQMVTYNLQVHQYDEYISDEVSVKVDTFGSE